MQVVNDVNDVNELNAERLLFAACDHGAGPDLLEAVAQVQHSDHSASGCRLVHANRLECLRRGKMTVLPSHVGMGDEIRVELPGRICPMLREDIGRRKIA